MSCAGGVGDTAVLAAVQTMASVRNEYLRRSGG